MALKKDYKNDDTLLARVAKNKLNIEGLEDEITLNVTNLREIIQGKSATYVLMYGDSGVTEDNFSDYTLYREDGTKIDTYDDFVSYVGASYVQCANGRYNSQEQVIYGDPVNYDTYLLLLNNIVRGAVLFQRVHRLWQHNGRIFHPFLQQQTIGVPRGLIRP